MDKAVKTYITVLKAEVEHLKSKLEPHDTDIYILLFLH